MCLQQADHNIARMALGHIAFVSPRLQLSRSFSTALNPLEEEAIAPHEVEDDQEPEESDIEEVKVEDLSMSPPEIVAQLDRFIIGQADAKRAVALALRNRWRRKKLDPKMRDEVMPKNILMIGPTGVGKTEIARRLAKLVNAPFIKVEATKYTETGFHGKDVDSIIQDLVEHALTLTRSRKRLQLKKQIERAVENRIIEALIGKTADKRRYASFREHYRMGALDEQVIYLNVRVKEPEMNMPSGITINLNQMMMQRKGHNAMEKRKMKVSEGRTLVEEEETEKMVNTDDVLKEALEAVQQDGIVFLDEIDKICSSGDRYSADASAEGVQRDLLPLIEGSTISTKHGNVETDHILFIASGAFHSVKPSDLLAELQGRLPIRVTLTALTQGDFYRILTEPENNLIKQQQLLMATEGVTVQFKDDAIKELAKVAFDVNSTVENIGARRLHTIIERVMEEVSFAATTKSGTTFEITEQYVKDRVSEMLKTKDLKRFLL
jgi:ATP-dependent HslUV protease ATP-binding subunit HslU